MKILPALFLLTTGLPLVATAATPTSGTVHVTENDAGNNTTSVNLNFSADTPDNVSFFLPGSNKGDYALDFLTPLNDFASGVLLSSVAEHLRANIDRTSYATTSTHARSDGLYDIPVHRIRAVKEAMIADIQFREARQRLFFMVRALEYKWNQPFFYAPLNYIAPQGGWNASSLFEMRNAAELKRFYDAMVDFDQDQNDNRPIEQFADHFSLREDFFGFYGQAFGTGAAQTYDVINPDTGQLETGLDAITAFRYELRRRLDPSTGRIAIDFDTVRRNGFEVSGEGIENVRG